MPDRPLTIRRQPRPVRVLLVATRIWLPLAIAIAGVVMIVVGHGRTRGAGATSLGNSIAAGGVAMLIVALIVWMVNWLFRLSVHSNRERDCEEAARRYFDQHGRWPEDEDGGRSVDRPGRWPEDEDGRAPADRLGRRGSGG